MSTITPCIHPNPDIAGIGVRVSVYTQAALNLICALIFAKDGQISDYEGTVLTSTSTNLFVTGFALLVNAFIQAKTTKFSVYHALIVLNLSWINALSAVLYPIINAVGMVMSLAHSLPPLSYSFTVFLLSIPYLTAMGAFGIFMWSTIDTFGDQSQCTPGIFFTIFSQNIPVTHPSLRKASIGLYSVTVPPFVNIAIVILVSAAICILLSLSFACITAVLPVGDTDDEDFSRFLLTGAVVIAASLEILLITDTELMIWRSVGIVVEAGESDWSFGQTLAMVLTVMPLFDTARAVYNSWNAPGLWNVRARDA